MEALLGAVYLDGGLRGRGRACSVACWRLTSDSEIAAALTADYKSQLAARGAGALEKPAPSIGLVDTTGPAHAREFTVEVWVGDRLLGRGTGRSKQQAEQAAARARPGSAWRRSRTTRRPLPRLLPREV